MEVKLKRRPFLSRFFRSYGAWRGMGFGKWKAIRAAFHMATIRGPVNGKFFGEEG